MRRWEEDLRATLEEKGVRIITLCTDTPGQIRAGRSKHGLKAVMLSDRDLAVTDAFGLRNRNTTLRPVGLPGLPVPTTLFLDEDGVVRWKDQADDYQQRSDPQRVLAGIGALLEQERT